MQIRSSFRPGLRKLALRARPLLVALVLAFAVREALLGQVSRLHTVSVPPDACRPTVMLIGGGHSGLIDTFNLQAGFVNIYDDPSAPSPLPLKTGKPLAFVINGNSYLLSDYDDLANHLARSGFVVAVAQRLLSAGNPEDFVIDAIFEVLERIGQSSSTPMALIGHSVGGGVAIDVAVRNQEDDLGFRIEGVVGLAPQVANVETFLDVEHTPAYLAIYGSQDQDVSALSEYSMGAFVAYDSSGTESSTTCHGGICLEQPNIDRTMIWVHGADHSGLINQAASCPNGDCEPYAPFLDTSDQFCIAKAYTEAFLHWTVADDTVYHNMIRGRWKPSSIHDIVSSDADQLGNPAGSPLRMFFQSSPAERSVITNFEAGIWNQASSTTAAVMSNLIENGEYFGDYPNVRHLSRTLAVGWPQHHTWQLFGITVPNGRRDVTGFSHVALRAGQFPLGSGDYENPFNEVHSILIGLVDRSSQSSWEALDPITFNDLRPNDATHTVMATFAERLTGFSGIDKSNIKAVYLAFPANTRGTLIIDSLEWWKD